MKPDEPDDPLVSAVKQQTERARRAQSPNLWGAFGVVGMVGWMVILPALVGVAVGRYIDTRFSAGIFWTLSLLMLGLALVCMAAWRHIDEVMKG